MHSRRINTECKVTVPNLQRRRFIGDQPFADDVIVRHDAFSLKSVRFKHTPEMTLPVNDRQREDRHQEPT